MSPNPFVGAFMGPKPYFKIRFKTQIEFYHLEPALYLTDPMET